MVREEGFDFDSLIERVIQALFDEKEALRRHLEGKMRRVNHLEKRLEEFEAREARADDIVTTMEDNFFRLESDMRAKIATLNHEAKNGESRLRSHIRALTHQVDSLLQV